MLHIHKKKGTQRTLKNNKTIQFKNQQKTGTATSPEDMKMTMMFHINSHQENEK